MPVLKFFWECSHVGQSGALHGDDVLDGHLVAVGLEDGAAVGIAARGHEVAQDEEIGHFLGSDQAHEIEIEV